MNIFQRRLCALCVGIGCLWSHAARADSVTITLPMSVTFFVDNVSGSTVGTPNPCTVSFSNASLAAGHALRISLKANASEFTPPGGTGKIAASGINWTTRNAIGGIAGSGTVSATGFTQLYESYADPGTGSVEVIWQLAAPGTAIRAGAHMLTLTWKVESVLP